MYLLLNAALVQSHLGAFFDSMADRTDDENIPEVCEATEVFNIIFADDMATRIEKHGIHVLDSMTSLKDKKSKNVAKRLLCDSYLTFYQILQ